MNCDSVIATSEIFPHVALRPGAYLPWAAPSSPVDYMVLDLRDAYPISEQQLHDLATVWLADADYQVLLDKDDVVVLKHGYRPPPVASEATFDNAIRLLGFGVERRNGALEVQLTWRALQAPGDEYHFFVHLVDGVGHTIGQQDGPPIPGAPAFVWPAGRALRTAVSLPAPLQAGPMHLEVGWYNWHTNQRLPLADGSDHATIPLPGE